MDSGFQLPVTAQQLQTLLSDTAPSSEVVSSVAGVVGMASREDHKHPRLSSATNGTLNAQGEATVTFSRLFAVMPVVNCLLIEAAANQPIIFKVKSWIQDGSNNYTGCVIKGTRLQTLPASLTLITQLISFNVSAGDASGVQFCCLAILPSV